jgi:transposase
MNDEEIKDFDSTGNIILTETFKVNAQKREIKEVANGQKPEIYYEFIKDVYNNNLVILDNDVFHKSKIVVENINANNKIIYSIPYNPSCNPIENFFSQLKNYVKNKSPDNFDELKNTIDKVIKKKIEKEPLKNYFNYLFIQATDYINKN